MNRKIFLRQSGMGLAALSLANQKWMTMFTDDPWKIKMLTEDIGVFTEKGGTIAFYLSKDGIVVVDAEFPEQSQHLISELRKRSDQPFKLLINTHHHGDHTAGNIAYKGIVGHVLAHTNSKTNQENVAKQKNNEDQQLYPDQVFTDTWSDKYGKEKISLYYHGAGHTNGDSMIHFQHANIVHMGDLMFNRRHPFVDRSAGASMKSWIKVLDKARSQFDDKTVFIYGHAGDGYEVTGSKDDLARFGDYLGRVLAFAESEIRSGKSKEEILKATGLPGETQWKGDGFQRPLQAAYEELTTAG